jgi:prepilin-type N-terminal cleavage/methylation domain-containing protein
VQDFYFSFGLPEILIGLAVLGVVLFVGLKLARLLWTGLLD